MDTAQSIGHGAAPHTADSVSAAALGHGVPPCSAAVVTVRLRACVPPPHVTEHASNAPHTLSTHATGHGCALHACASTSDAHAASLPPYAAAVVTLRVRVWLPPPQSTLHAPNGPQTDVAQSTGHCLSMHA